MISKTTLASKPTVLDDGTGMYVNVAADTDAVRVTVNGSTHQLDAGLTAAYETCGHELTAAAVNGSAEVRHDGNQPGEAGSFPRFPLITAIRLTEPTEAWLARSRMDQRDWTTSTNFDQAVAHKRADVANAACADSAVRAANVQMQAEREPARPPAPAPMTLAELQAKIDAAEAARAVEDAVQRNRELAGRSW